MAILWCGGEDIDFPAGALPGTTATLRTGYSRCSVWPVNPNQFIKSFGFAGGPVTSCWLTCRLATNLYGTANNKQVGLCLGSSGASGLYLGCDTTTATKLALFKYDGTTTTKLAAETGTSLAGSSPSVLRIDMQLINYGVSATVNAYLNGILLITYSGDVTVSGVTSVDCVASSYGGSFGQWGLSEIIVTDEDPRAWPGLLTMAPNALGTTDAWSNTGATNVNPTTINDANATFTNATAQDEQYNLIDPPSGVFTVKAIKIAARAMSTSGATAANLKLGFNNAGTVATNPQHTMTTAFATFEDLFATDPTTSSAWNSSDLAGLQVELKSA